MLTDGVDALQMNVICSTIFSITRVGSTEQDHTKSLEMNIL